MPVCDLRSDTLTRPTPAMRAAMANADVGDDVYGEDPTVRALEERCAALLGKEAALFVPSGTMGNQIALLVHTRPGDEVIVGEGAHCAFFESGAGAAWAGVQFAIAGRGGLYTAEQMLEALKPRSFHYPRSSLVVVENTHNRSGGRVFPSTEVARIAEAARGQGLSLHLDGARLWNASAATGASVAQLAAPFDTVNVCFSKGLGAPVGSAIAGTRDHVLAARRFRKMLGGGMRQAGILAAAALYALEHHRERLAEDHRSAALLSELLSGAPGVAPSRAETNIVMLDLQTQDAAELARSAAERGVLLNVTGKRQLRAVTHLDVSETQVRAGADVLRSLIHAS
ncbi:MAG: aminotransferase class I/II-fold pyridoxal phosphate-dependent enzyme [Myxococcales bacterium]|nr:MAG: aminotransferase class I/II-fold pyridoxal phosphate-dependent enzyme [Myxococcales bacterium]